MVGARGKSTDEVPEAGEGGCARLDEVGHEPAGGHHPAAALADGDQLDFRVR